MLWGMAATLAHGGVIDVGSAGVPDVRAALDQAQPGDVLQLRGGVYEGSHVVTVDGLVVEPAKGAVVVLVSAKEGPSDNPTSHGFFRASGVTLTVRDLTMDGDASFRVAAASEPGGHLILDNVEVRNASHLGSGAGVVVNEVASLTVTNSTFRDNTSLQGDGGAIFAHLGSTVLVSESTFTGCTAEQDGGAVNCRGACTITDSVLSDNEAVAGNGGALAVAFSPGVELRGNRLCDNRAGRDGGAVFVGTGASGTFGFNVLWGNEASASGGAVYAASPVTWFNNDFLDNEANGLGAAGAAPFAATTFVNSLVVGHRGSASAVFSGSGVTLSHTMTFDNDLPYVGNGVTTSLSWDDDPSFVGFDPSDCLGSDLHLAFDSPAVGLGDETYGDDLGAFGVGCSEDQPEVPGDGVDQDCDGVDDCFEDLDEDGFGDSRRTLPGTDLTCDEPGVSSQDGDCDDDDPAVNPAADEIPLDGVDQDCDGTEDCYEDDDGDGYGEGRPNEESEDLTCSEEGVSLIGGDCDDREPMVHPGVVEIDCNGLDDDCDAATPDGCDDPQGGGFRGAGCGCDPVSGLTVGWALVLLLAPYAGRRRCALS
ncbi:MAG: right-handed parallel beta-helix repeat-containing protein [Myxococcales bacterium]|nr:right-handed parallel beta-helix repeat-containing protein [Myxococcales bacterium]